MTTNSQLLTTEPKNNITKNKLSKQLEQEQKWRSHGGLSAGQWVGREEEKVQRISSINGR